MGLRLITCGVEWLVDGVHTLLGGVVQVYHGLHGGEDQGEENAHMDDYVDSVKRGKHFKLEPQCMCVCADENKTTTLRECALRSVDVDSGVHIVRCRASMDVGIDVRVVECHAIIHVVIGVRIVLCCPLVDFPLRVQILIVVML